MHSLSQLDRNMPILVVDDYPSMRRIVKNCLRQLGFENVTEAEDAPSAIAKLQSEDFKFVISDCNIPNLSAVDLLEQLRGDGKSVPVLMVAAEQEKAKLPPLAENDKADVIVKPFTREILQKKMEGILCG